MPLTTTHALVPLAGAIAFGQRPIRWKLLIAAGLAAALPDIDYFSPRIAPASYILSHRGASHSLFTALAAGMLAALAYRSFSVNPLTAGVVIAGSMASHGLLDMMSDSGEPVAYLWPLSSLRVFADYRPIHGGAVYLSHFVTDALARQQSELWQIAIPMFASAVVFRAVRTLARRV